jgi:methionyl-tRNA formyltransferase
MTRVVFMGSPEEVVAPLRLLSDRGPDLGLELVAVISQPARPVGRGGRLTDPPVAEFAKSRQIVCLQPESSKSADFIADFSALDPDIVVTAAYGQILSDQFLAVPKIGTVNIHPSRLPQYRGATPVPAALLDGLTSTAVTILFTVKKLDAGNIITQRDFAIDPAETSGVLTARLFSESGPMLLEALTKLAGDPAFKGIPQDDTKATFCKKIDKDMGCVDWSLDSGTIVNRFRAFEPWPGSWTMAGDRRIVITEMRVLRASSAAESAEVGLVTFDKPSKSLVIRAGTGQVSVGRVRPAGGKDMDAASFWNGLKDKAKVMFHGQGESEGQIR